MNINGKNTMLNTTKTSILATIFTMNEEEMFRRKMVGSYIHSFSALIAERFYHYYMIKDPLYNNICSSIDSLLFIRKFSDYFNSLFILPFDDRLIVRTHEIAEIFIATGLKQILLIKAFNTLNEIIIDLSKVNNELYADLSIILKIIRISESIMYETYFEQLSGHQEELKKENLTLNLFDKLFTALMVHKKSQKKLTKVWANRATHSLKEVARDFHNETTCPLNTLIEELATKQTHLESLGIDFIKMKALHHKYHQLLDQLLVSTRGSENIYDEIESISTELYALIDKPLSDITTTAFLGVHSGIEFLQSCSSVFTKNLIKDTSPEEISERLYIQLTKALGWCIDELYVGINEIDFQTSMDVVGKIIIQYQQINIFVKIKQISNKDYMVEIIKILLEIMKQNVHNQEREHTLIQLVDRVERASKAKDMFLANMSHELRTPLNAIIGFSQIIRMNKSLPETLKPYIEKIGIAGNNLLTLVNTILDFAKLEAGKLNFKPEITLVSTMLRDVAIIIEPLAEKKSIIFEYPQILSLGLYLDRQLINQVLLNLLSNAIKFTPEHGIVKLVLDFDEEKKFYRFGVCDSGIGIESKDIQSLFDPFTQVENSFQKSAKGTGLGLAIAKKIVEDLHGGKLWVESEFGIGSCFYFTIPISQMQNTLERYLCDNTSAKKVLIVEDAFEYQKILIDRLDVDFHLTITNSVNKAKEILENESFDFIVLDFFLIDGISSELLQFMDQNQIYIPVIIISAEEDSQLISHLPDSETVEAIFNKINVNDICDYLTNQTSLIA